MCPAGSASRNGSSAIEAAGDVPQAAVTVMLADGTRAKEAQGTLTEQAELSSHTVGVPATAEPYERDPPSVAFMSPSVATICQDREDDCLAELD